MRKIKLTIAIIFGLFILPVLLFGAWWTIKERPTSWRTADWSASGLLTAAELSPAPVIYVLAARTGGLKGALSVHTWIVLKEEGGVYERYDKVGWGSPIRRNAYPPDGRWYSNPPYLVKAISGDQAKSLIPLVRQAVAAYPYAAQGDYSIWPGPNSNSFVAHVLRNVPDLGATMPSNAIGRDYQPDWASFAYDRARGGIRLSLGGLVGVAASRWGVEFNLFGLVAGADFHDPALLLPGFGRVAFWPQTAVAATQDKG
ncbi:DUF3750 domain-containing protein [Nitratireductor luteus]|uniref:DUF3750 domain-containing protein n=1 Tax=Nitratireductor luteus TaxID=2976980 RepID=UPI00223FCF8B